MTVLQGAIQDFARTAADGLRRRIAAVTAGVTVLLLVALLHETAAAIVTTWANSETFGHGFLILPVCAYIAWCTRGRAAGITPRPSLSGLLIAAPASLGWLFGDVTGTLIVQEFSLVVLIEAALLMIFGWRLCRIFGFALVYLFFAVPLGLELIPPLQTVTANFAVGLLRLVNVPVFSDGYIISIPTGNWYVAEACSGVRYLIASVAFGTLLAGIMLRTWWRRAAFLALSIAAPIVANGIRAFGIILIAYVSNNELATGVDHILYGWLFFTLVTALVTAVGYAMREATGDVSVIGLPPPAAVGDGVPGRVLLAAALALLPTIGAKLYGMHVLEAPPSLAVINLVASDPAVASNESGEQQEPLAGHFAGADAELQTTYQARDGQKVQLQIGYYRFDRPGAQAASYENELIVVPGWTERRAGTASVKVGSERVEVRAERIVRGHRERLIWSWYWVDGRFTGSPYLVRLLDAKVKLLGGETPTAVIALVTERDADDTGAERDMREVAELAGRALVHASGSGSDQQRREPNGS